MWLTSVIPAQGSDCSGALGSGYLNVLNIFTGTSPLQNSFFDTTATIPGSGSNPAGLIGSMGIVGGMPTEVNVTSQLATVGDGGGGSPVSFKRTLPLGGIPQRMTWREIVPQDD
jgi:type IV pilus assembly protein PilY1